MPRSSCSSAPCSFGHPARARSTPSRGFRRRSSRPSRPGGWPRQPLFPESTGTSRDCWRPR
eukprot:7004126-Lingulodinium_polyedra.AAC.1